MNYTYINALSLLGALGFFIYGMKVMSEGIQKVAGSRIRNVLEAMTSSRFKGVFTGFLITALVQSSSATTVMVVSFVNAGLLTLIESIGVIMGANIGTTITAWIISISIIDFKVNVSALALPLLAVGVPFLFVRKSKIRSWGEAIIGFALLFMGLQALKETVPDLQSNPEILSFLQQYTDMGYLSIILFVFIGTLITVIVQSSSAAIAVTIVMASQGWISFELAAAMVLGENIGTTITAIIAAVVANVHAKRAAFAHLVFNIGGVIWIMFLLLPILNLIGFYMQTTMDDSPFVVAAAIPIGLSIFHTLFNVINTAIMVWFVPAIANLVTKMVPSRGDDEKFHLEYIGMNIVTTPEISILEARKELAGFAGINSRMSDFMEILISKKQHKSRKKIMDKIRNYESITDRMEVEIARFLSRVSESNISEETSSKIRALLSINNDLKRIADLFYRLSLIIERQLESEYWFSNTQIENLLVIYDLLNKALDVMKENLDSDYSEVLIDKANEMERLINAKRNELRRDYLKKVETGEFTVKDAINYLELVNGCEKVGDHVINVSQAITGRL